MEVKDIKEALIKMGYREAFKDRYAKPVGCGLFTFELSIMTWTNWFKSASNNQILVWSSEKYNVEKNKWEGHTEQEAFLGWLKTTEGLARLDYHNATSEFEFFTQEEYLNHLL